MLCSRRHELPLPTSGHMKQWSKSTLRQAHQHAGWDTAFLKLLRHLCGHVCAFMPRSGLLCCPFQGHSELPRCFESCYGHVHPRWNAMQGVGGQRMHALCLYSCIHIFVVILHILCHKIRLCSKGSTLRTSPSQISKSLGP